MMMQFDFTEAKPLAQYMKKGTYTAKVVGSEIKQTKNGNNQLVITFENSQGEKIIHYAGLDFTKQYPRDWMADFLTKLGFVVMGQCMNFTPEMIKNKFCVITVDDEWNDYNNKYYPRVKRIEENAIGTDGKVQNIYIIDETPTPPPPTRGNASDFDFSEAIPPAQFDAALDISDDDLPF